MKIQKKIWGGGDGGVGGGVEGGSGGGVGLRGVRGEGSG